MGAAPEEKGVKKWSVRDLFFLFPFGFDLAVVLQQVLRVRGLHPVSRDAPWRASCSQRLVLLYVQERAFGLIRHVRGALGRRFRCKEVPLGAPRAAHVWRVRAVARRMVCPIRHAAS